MSPAVLSIIIILIALVLYLTKIPLGVTSILAMLAMCLFGLTTYAKAYAGFSNVAMLLIAGMAVVAQGIVESGLAQKIGNVLLKVTKGNEKVFILLWLSQFFFRSATPSSSAPTAPSPVSTATCQSVSPAPWATT